MFYILHLEAVTWVASKVRLFSINLDICNILPCKYTLEINNKKLGKTFEFVLNLSGGQNASPEYNYN